MPIVKCNYCQKEIYRKPYDIKTHKKHYCCTEHMGLDRRELNNIVIKENHAEMIINKYNTDYIVLIDIDDIEKINNIKWILKYDKTINDFYVSGWERGKGNKDRKRIALHRLIMNCSNDVEVDHINRCPRDNRKCNLRVVESMINKQNKGFYKNNKSGYKYISWSKRIEKWIIEVKRNNVTTRIGATKDLMEAIEMRNQYCKENGIKIIDNPKWVDVVEAIKGVE